MVRSNDFTFGGGGMMTVVPSQPITYAPPVVVPSVPMTSPSPTVMPSEPMPTFGGGGMITDAPSTPTNAGPRPATPPSTGTDYYSQLQEYLSSLGLMGDNGMVDQQSYYGYTRPTGAVQQEDVPWLLGINNLLSDRFATNVSGGERDAMRQELAQKYLDYLKPFEDGSAEQPEFTWGENPTFAPPRPGGPNGESPGGSDFTPADVTFTSRGNSTPFLDSYMRVREQQQTKGPATTLFAKELNNV